MSSGTPDKQSSKMEAKEEIQVTGTCSVCRRPLTQLGPNAECLRCLFNWGVEDKQSDEGSAVSGRLPPAQLRYAHFEVEVGADGMPVELGAGAMAVTYRAWDTVLNSVVALKVINRKVAENPAARSRFLREARAAAQIHHPNVARVIHYGEQDGECFYAMELVEGETLEGCVRRDGSMPVSLALEVIEQVTRALAAAQVCGVVHRDLKPSNIMIESDASESLMVKVIDYGVAKVMTAPAETDASQIRTGFIGTPAFASPEQFGEAGRSRTDARSDIYSLGVTLWYLLCGRTPFAGRTLEEIRVKQTTALPLHQLRNTHVPRQVIALLRSMLAVDPEERPQSARELLPLVHRSYLRFEPRARTRRIRLGLAVGVLALSIAAIAIGMWAYQHAQSVARAERSIAVLPFDNLSPGTEEAFFTVGMQDEVAADLARLADMTVIGTQSTRSYSPGKDRNLPAIGRELGVRHLLEGSVSRANGAMRIALRLVDTRDIDHPWTQSYERPIIDVFAVQSEITRSIATRLHTRLSPNETAALAVPPTSDLQAYDLYLRSLAIPRLVRDTAEQRQVHLQTVRLLDEAVMRDPKFVLAFCALARVHDGLYRARVGASDEDLAVDHRALAEAALEKARRLQPDAGPVHLALANHFFLANRDIEQARTEVDLARRSLPNTGDLELLAGEIAREQGRWDDAVRCFEKAVALEPRANVIRFTLANTQRLLRHYSDFDRLITEVIGMMPAKDSATYRLFRALGTLESHAAVAPLRAAVSNLSREEDPDGRIRDLHNVILSLADHNADAVLRGLDPASESTFVFNGVAYPKAWYEGLAARIRGDPAGARTAFTAARVKVERAVLSDVADARQLGLLAMIDAGLGRREEALREARHACELAPFEKAAMDAPIVRCNLAVVYAWTGDSDLAIDELDKLVVKPGGSNLPAQPTYGDFRLNPVWDPLRRDRRFQALTDRLAPTPIR
jgi:serine/threonine protein kinase/Flp pilus assembly protein TadD